MPDELLPKSDTSGAGRAFTLPLYGFKKWSDLFTSRQVMALMAFVKRTRMARMEMEKLGYPVEWVEAVEAYLAILIDRLADYNSTICTWHINLEAMGHTYTRFALPITWDFAELNPFSKKTGGYLPQIGWGRAFSGKRTGGKIDYCTLHQSAIESRSTRSND